MRDPDTRFRPGLHRHRGFALVAVLSMLALLMVLVVALMSMARSESQSTSRYTAGIEARLVADSAMAVALAQLRSATSQTDGSGRPKLWTSQPGGIRVFDSSGRTHDLFKLFSAQNMVDTSSQGTSSEDLLLEWERFPDQFVDLNRSYRRPGSTDAEFPILDPRLFTGGPDSVEGFRYSNLAGAVGPGDPNRAQRLPMPVRWIYQLANGTLGTLNRAGRFVASDPDAKVAGQPIVARFAFWVDDESSKINVNTASEGAFWDTPRVSTEQDVSLAAMQPTRLEYHRQPGHPAGVSLSAFLLPGYRFHPVGFEGLLGNQGPWQNMELEDARDLWRLGRLHVSEALEETSLGGRQDPSLLIPGSTPEPPTPRVRQVRYASASELLFDHAEADHYPDVWQYAEPEEGRRTVHRLFQRHPQARQRLGRSQGFLTTVSASPEVTPFGTPKVIAWPAHASTPAPGDPSGSPIDGWEGRYTSYDRKVSLLGTVGEKRFFVQRGEPGSGANDLMITGQGQNLQLLSYLRTLTDQPIPGWNNVEAGYTTFAQKYGSGMDEDRETILLSMLDYVRSSNFADGHLDENNQYSIVCNAPGLAHHGFGQVTGFQDEVRLNRIEDEPAKGHGRMMTISEVAMVISCPFERGVNRPSRREYAHLDIEARRLVRELQNPGDRIIQVAFLLEGFVPSEGWVDYRPYASAMLMGGAPGELEESEWPSWTLNGETLGPHRRYQSRVESSDTLPASWKGYGSSLGVRGLSSGYLVTQPVVVKAVPDPSSPTGFSAPKLDLRPVAGETQQLKIALYDNPGAAGSGSSASLDLIQVVPLPIAPIEGTMELPSQGGVTSTFFDRFETSIDEPNQSILTDTDVVQSFVLPHGDYRLVSGRVWAQDPEAGESLLLPHPAWGQQQFAHALRDPAIPQRHRAPAATSYFEDLAVGASFAPEIPLRVAGPREQLRWWSGGGWQSMDGEAWLASHRKDGGRRGPAWPHLTGDFDNGAGRSPDGPYLNRPDDGHWAALDQRGVPFYQDFNGESSRNVIPPVSPAAFSAQRLFPSPVMFGSLPTGVRAQVPWQTLLFRPHENHYGAASPPDHLLLEMFWTPVLEPEPLARNFETEGKVNLNHELLPFTHIERRTALHAAMKTETLLAIPDEKAAVYKSASMDEEGYRHPIDADATLDLWQQELAGEGGVFRTASQICEQYLVPEGQEASREAMEEFWRQHRLTGDNSKERPYAHLHGRVATRSNVFRVHFVAQSLQQARSGEAGSFQSGRDQVRAEVRGSSLVRRHLDAATTVLPDYLEDPGAPPLNSFYEWQLGAPRWHP